MHFVGSKGFSNVRVQTCVASTSLLELGVSRSPKSHPPSLSDLKARAHQVARSSREEEEMAG